MGIRCLSECGLYWWKIPSILWKDYGSRACGGTFRKPRGQGEGRVMQPSHCSSGLVDGVSTLFPAALCPCRAWVKPAKWLCSEVPSFACRLKQSLLGLHILAAGRGQVVLPPRSQAQMTIFSYFSFPALFTKDLAVCSSSAVILAAHVLLLWWWCNFSELIVGGNNYCQYISAA